MPTAQVNGIALEYYRRAGSPQVLLVHGLATSMAFWYLGVVPALGRDLGLVLFDLRGHGRSGMSPSGYTTADMAGDIAALLDHLEIERVHCIGHSYGGGVALHFALLHPARVARLVLADARIRALQPTQPGEDHAEVAAAGSATAEASPALESHMGVGHLEALADAQERQVRPPGLRPARYSPFGLGRGRNVTARRWLRLLRTTTARTEFAMEAGLTAERLHEVQHPTLLIFGEHSHCLPSFRGLQAHLPNWRAVLVPRAGHFHPMVRPLYFARAVRSFIEEKI